LSRVKAADPDPADGAKEQRIANWLSRQDSNKDGKIALNESSGQMKANFRRNDANGDGFIDKEELGSLADRLSGTAARSRRPNTAARSRNPNTGPVPTDEQVMGRVPDGVTVELNLSYRDGNDAWKLDLARPTKESDKPRPAIVFIHGGGWTKGDKRLGQFLNLALEYAAKGYVCVSVNYRLDATKLPCIQDVKCAVRWLRAHAKKYNIDPERIGAYGNSAGAHLATMLGVSHKEERLEGDSPWQDFSSAVQAVVSSATPTLPRIRGGADFDVELIQPMSYVSADAPPMFLVHEESDPVVPVSQSDDFVKALKEVGARDITYKRYNDGSGHGAFFRNMKETGPAMEAFFARTLMKKANK
jgi:acetyl esterase/lipase